MEIFLLNNNNNKSHFNYIFILKKVMCHPLDKFIVKNSELIISIDTYFIQSGKKVLLLSFLNFYYISIAKRK